MINGWYIVFILMCGLNGLLYGTMGCSLKTWQFWVSVFIPPLCYIAGTNRY